MVSSSGGGAAQRIPPFAPLVLQLNGSFIESKDTRIIRLLRLLQEPQHLRSAFHSSGTLLRREIIGDFDKLAVMQPLHLQMPGNRCNGIASLLGYIPSALAWVFGELLKHSAVNSVTWLG